MLIKTPSRNPIPILIMHDDFFDIIEEINHWWLRMDQIVHDFTYSYPKPSKSALLPFNRLITILTRLDKLKITDREAYDFNHQGRHCVCRCNDILSAIEQL